MFQVPGRLINLDIIKCTALHVRKKKLVLYKSERIRYFKLFRGGGGGGGGGDQVPSAGLHVGGWVIFSPKNTVSTWY